MTVIIRFILGQFTRTGGNAARELGPLSTIIVHARVFEFTRTGGS